jgi:methyl-accepting chemotaxis protein
MKQFACLFQRLDRLSTAMKMGLAFALVLTLTAALGVASVYALSRLKSASDSLANNWLPAVGQWALVRAAALEVREFQVKHTTAADAGHMSDYEENMAAALGVVKTALDAHSQLISEVKEGDLRKAFDQR